MVVLITAHSWFGISNPVQNLISYLKYNKIPFYESHIVEDKPDRLAVIISLWKNIFNLLKFSRTNDSISKVFCYEPISLLIAFLIFKRELIIYHQLEFSSKTRFKGLIEYLIEKTILPQISLILSFDKVRTEYLRSKFRLKDVFEVPNTPFLSDPTETLNSINYRKGNSDLIIISIAGSLIREHCILEILSSLSQIENKIRIKVHGWFSEEVYKKEVLNLIEKTKNITYYGKTTDKKEIFAGVDYGIIIYDTSNDNTRLAGASSGRLFEYMLNGIPVLVADTPGMDKILMDLNFGYIFKKFNELTKLLSPQNTRNQLFFNSKKYMESYDFGRKISSIITNHNEY